MKKFNQDIMKTREILSEFLLILKKYALERDVWDVRNTDSDFMNFAVIIINEIENEMKDKITSLFKEIELI